MESSFTLFLRLGVEHISDLKGYDHMLFITALCAVYQFAQWKHLLWLVTAFTIGHSITLALATLDVITINSGLVEFLIPVTIFVTSLVNIVLEIRGKHTRKAEQQSEYAKYALALGFGLIHGMGFSNFLRAMLGGEESIVAPLFAFNIGLEIGQIMILAVVLVLSTTMVRVVGLAQRDWSLILSGGTAGAALLMIVNALG
ncbi:MAG: HupE/UreJ family protein [Rhodothermales bacterium]